MKLIKRSRRPKGTFHIGPSMNDHGHWFYVKVDDTHWTCHTCGARFGRYPYEHKCSKDRLAAPRMIKREYLNGELIGGTEYIKPSRLIRKKP